MNQLRGPGAALGMLSKPWKVCNPISSKRHMSVLRRWSEGTARLSARNSVISCFRLFQSRIAEEESAFTLDDVIDGIRRKLIRRHPMFSVIKKGWTQQQWKNNGSKSSGLSSCRGQPLDRLGDSAGGAWTSASGSVGGESSTRRLGLDRCPIGSSQGRRRITRVSGSSALWRPGGDRRGV